CHDGGCDAVMVSSMWTPGSRAPSAQERLTLGNVVKAADTEGMQVFVFVWHGLNGATPRTVAARQRFAAYSAALARGFPQIRHIVVGNEPNLNTFWLPQFGPDGSDAAAKGYLDLLARTYDALKAVSSHIQVIGGALAPRGSDRPGTMRGTQAKYYREALELAACQPTVKALFVFHTFDETDLAGWQSGLYYADQKPKPSLPAFRAAAADARAARLTRCVGTTFIPKS